jgi:type IV pilus assembly protein PilC
MLYPIIVLFVMFGVISISWLVKLLPAVQNLYSTFPGAQLPLITRLLAQFGALRHSLPGGLVILVLGVLSLSVPQDGARVPTVEKLSIEFKMRAPGHFLDLFMKIYMSRFARTSCTLVGSGVPLLQVLEITGDAVSNVHIQDSLKKSCRPKLKGEKLCLTCLVKTLIFYP